MGVEREPLRMSRVQFWGSFVILVLLFLLVEGPIWSHPWDIRAVDRAILLSYLPIPLLVAGCLLWSRRLTLVGFFLDTLTLTFVKYSATALFALSMWAGAPAPKGIAVAPPMARAPLVEEAPAPPSVIPAARRGSVRGTVLDADGKPVASAFVFIAKGLEGLTFAPPSDPLSLSNDGTGIVPRLAIAQAGQRIEAHATDGRLHTFVAAAVGAAPVFHVPLLKSGAASIASVREPHASLALRCTVHPDEQPATLIVLGHRFFATTGSDGSFSIEGIPATQGTLKTVTADHREVETAVDIVPSGTTVAEISLAR
jgi:hypothetical protein